MEKINENPDHESMNSDFAAIPALNPIPLLMAQQLQKDTQQSDILDPTELTNQTNPALLDDPVTGIVKSPLMGISELIQSQQAILSTSAEDASVTGAPGENPLSSLSLSDIRGRSNVKSDIPLIDRK